MSSNRFRLGLIAAAVLSATACGGGGDGGSGQQQAEVIGSTSGVLYDAGVEGVAYSTSSGVKGVTGAGGSYRFNPGDKVTFTLGALTLGTVTATGMVTPLELAAGSAVKLNNLLVLLQSLDKDGVAGNGITIPAAAAAAVPATLQLGQPFADADRNLVLAAMKAGGITSPIKTQDQANAGFAAEAMTVLSAGESAIWVQFDANTAVTLRIRKDGEYLHGEAMPDSYCGSNNECGPTVITTAGVEAGKAAATKFNDKGFELTPVANRVDTNLQAGLSHPFPDARFRSNGESLIVTEGVRPPVELKKLFNDPAGIRGAWALGSASDPHVVTLHFFDNGRFLLADPIGDTAASSCGGPGVEFGSFAWDSASKALAISNMRYDTNGCAGLNDPQASSQTIMSFALSADGKTASLKVGSEAPVTLFRVSR